MPTYIKCNVCAYVCDVRYVREYVGCGVCVRHACSVVCVCVSVLLAHDNSCSSVNLIANIMSYFLCLSGSFSFNIMYINNSILSKCDIYCNSTMMIMI